MAHAKRFIDYPLVMLSGSIFSDRITEGKKMEQNPNAVNDEDRQDAGSDAPRVLEIGSHRFTKVICTDKPGAGGACHEYDVVKADYDSEAVDRVQHSPYAVVRFQNGPIKEAGVNGCFQEDLLAIVIDRLEHFQAGDYACRENALALTKCEEALQWLNSRTAGRQKRGVEGTSVQ